MYIANVGLGPVMAMRIYRHTIQAIYETPTSYIQDTLFIQLSVNVIVIRFVTHVMSFLQVQYD